MFGLARRTRRLRSPTELAASAPLRRSPAIDGFAAAVQFLTRVPVRTRATPDVGAAVGWFPVVGGFIGACVGGVAAGLGEVVPMPVAAAVAVLFGIAITGALHEDGLADTADALAGGSTRERRLEILDDPRHGSYGVAALCGSIVVRVVAVAVLTPAAAFAGLVAAHALARGAAVATMGVVPLAKPDGLGAGYARSVTHARTAFTGLVAVAIVAVATGWWAGPLTVAAVAAAALVAFFAQRAIGGITGDVLGAVEQLAECTVLVVVTGLAAHGRVWWA
jgi:adenosylcobinamide-GDP ribazoletransferase